MKLRGEQVNTIFDKDRLTNLNNLDNDEVVNYIIEFLGKTHKIPEDRFSA